MRPTLFARFTADAELLAEVQAMLESRAFKAVMEEARLVSRPRPVITTAIGADAITLHALSNADCVARNQVLTWMETVVDRFADDAVRDLTDDAEGHFGADEVMRRQDPLRGQAQA